MGVPDALADKMAALLLTRAALDISDLAAQFKRDTVETARLYSAFNENLGIFWLHVCAENLEVNGRWQAMARGNLRNELYQIRRELAIQLLKKRSKKPMPELVDRWLDQRSSRVARVKSMIEEMKLRGDADFATLFVAAQELRDLLDDPAARK
jgi:glutamate dehydrogenase